MKNNKLKVVLDTNVLMVSILSQFRFYPIIEAVRNNEIQMCISNEILTEYTEILLTRYKPNFIEPLISALINLPNVHFYDPTFQWKLIYADADDDKFVDCTVASSADFLVTNDKHYNVLKTIDFPKINVINADDFLAILLSN